MKIQKSPPQNANAKLVALLPAMSWWVEITLALVVSIWMRVPPVFEGQKP